MSNASNMAFLEPTNRAYTGPIGKPGEKKMSKRQLHMEPGLDSSVSEETTRFISVDPEFLKPKAVKVRKQAWRPVIEDYTDKPPESGLHSYLTRDQQKKVDSEAQQGEQKGQSAEKGKEMAGKYSLPRAQWGKDTKEALTKAWEAAYRDDFDALSALLTKEPKLVHARTADGRGPLFWAHEYGRQMMIMLLLKAGCNPNARDAVDKTPAGVAAEVYKPMH